MASGQGGHAFSREQRATVAEAGRQAIVADKADRNVDNQTDREGQSAQISMVLLRALGDLAGTKEKVMSHIYPCFVEDRRYRVPTLRLLQADDVQMLRRLALRELLASEDHQAVEVRAEGGQLILREERSS
jgi:hypothetical protein